MLKAGDRVRFTDISSLSDGVILKVLEKSFYEVYIIKLDKKATDEYAWDTDEILSFGDDIELIK